MKTLLKLFGQIVFLIFYPSLTVFITLYLRLGALSWLVLVVCLTPPTLAWYLIMKKRMDNYFALLMDNKNREWNISKSIKEYLELLKKHEKPKG